MSNADAIAFAVIGAARAAGVDPVEALTTLERHKHSPAKIVPAAINALAADRDDRLALARVLDRPIKSVEGAAMRGSAPYFAAVEGAKALVRFAAEACAEEVDPPAPEAPVIIGIDAGSPAAAVTAMIPAPTYEPPKGAGMVSQQTSPFAIAFKPLAASPTSLRARIVEQLEEGTFSAQALATVLDAKELMVIQSLNQLEAEGAVLADRSAGSNSRAVRWSLRETATA